MTLKEITEKIAQVSDLYEKRFSIKRDPDWYVLKIQEEVGELASVYLKLTGRARRDDTKVAEYQANLEDEIADVIGMALLFARHQGIDIEKAIVNKWFQYLEEPQK